MLNGVIFQGDIDLKPEDLVSDDAKSLIASAIPGLTAESIESFSIFDQLKRLNSKRKITFWYGARSKRKMF